MNAGKQIASSGVRYEADEKPPILLTIGLGLQIALLTVGGVVLTVAIVSRAGGASEAYLTWGVFAAAAISGTTTILQAVPGRQDRCGLCTDDGYLRQLHRGMYHGPG